MKKITFLLFAILPFAVFSQNEDLKPSLIPPAPDAAALARYGEIQTSPYTGTPSISVPLHVIKFNDLSVPITLNYDASGIRVSQQASWVGLAWSLNAGGVITRSVRSLYDNDAAYNYKTLPSSFLSTMATTGMLTGSDLTVAKNISNQLQDGEPDIYFFSFNGRSGKFIETADGFKVLDIEDLKIEKGAGQWVITDEKGIKYVFSIEEETRPSNYKDTRDFVSSWYLRYIDSPNGTRISFHYKSVGTERTPNQLSRSYDINYNQSGYPSFSGNNRTTVSYSKILEKKILQKITYPGGEVYFHSQSGRLDTQTSDASGAYPPGHFLWGMNVRAADGQTIKYFKFNYGYFNNGAGSFDKYRLKLDKIIEAPDSTSILDETKTRSHRFEYDETSLPSVLSENQDHWGYYTGRGNQLLPAYDFTNLRLRVEDRDPAQFAVTAGTLRKIFYPTGGSTEMIFQPHDYGYVSTTPVNEIILSSQSYSANAFKPEVPANGQYSTKYSSIIDVASGDVVDLHIQFNHTSLPNEQQLRVEVIKPIFMPLDAEPIPSNIYSETIVKTVVANNPIFNEQLNLSPGRYFIRAITQLDGTSVFSELNVTSSSGIAKTKKAGGLRIYKIVQFDPVSGKSITKRYTYTDEQDPTRSSGVLVTPVKYDFQRTTTTGVLIEPVTGLREADMTNGCEADLVRRWLEVRSSSVTPLGETSGSHVGYNRVVIEDIDENGNSLGKTVENYVSPSRFVDHPRAFPASSGTNYDLFRGKLLNQTIFNAAGAKVKEIINEYDFSTRSLYASIAMVSKYEMLMSAQSVHPCAFDYVVYNNVVGKALLKRTITKDYSQTNPSAFHQNKTTYYYEKLNATPADRAHILPTKSVEWTSKGDSISTVNTYSQDFPADAMLNELFSRHIFSPVEVTKTLIKAAKPLYYRKYYYALFNNVPQLQRIEDRHTGTQTEKVIEFERYDVEGRITQLKDKTGVVETYRWNSALGLPNAKIVNAIASDVYVEDFENTLGTSTPGDANTGAKSRLSSFTLTLSGLTNGEYELSYWKKISGIWTLTKTPVTVTGGSYSNTISGQIDDLRFKPLRAQIISYVYRNDGSIVAIIDPDHRRSFFEYDGLGRLVLTKDDKGNIEKTFDYNLTPDRN